MALGVALAIGQKLLGGFGSGVKDFIIEKSTQKEIEITKRLEVQEQTKRLEIQKEIAEKGLEKSINSLQEQQEITKQSQTNATASTYNTFAEIATKQTQYNVNKLSIETNDYLATFRPKHTEAVFNNIIKLIQFSGLYYGVLLLGFVCIFIFSKENAIKLVDVSIGFNYSILMIPIPQNILSGFLCFPLVVLYWLYEQWSYQQTYWFISRDEEKERFQKKNS